MVRIVGNKEECGDGDGDGDGDVSPRGDVSPCQLSPPYLIKYIQFNDYFIIGIKADYE